MGLTWALFGKVVKFWPAWTGLAMVAGVPRPPPSCPSTTSEVATGRSLVRLISTLLPAVAMMVGPGAQAALVAQALLSQKPHIGAVVPSRKVTVMRCAVRLIGELTAPARSAIGRDRGDGKGGRAAGVLEPHDTLNSTSAATPTTIERRELLEVLERI